MAPLKTIIHPIAASWVRHKRVYHGSAISEGLLSLLRSAPDVFEIGGVVVIHLTAHRITSRSVARNTAPAAAHLISGCVGFD